jgi:hypothetical protein
MDQLGSTFMTRSSHRVYTISIIIDIVLREKNVLRVK